MDDEIEKGCASTCTSGQIEDGVVYCCEEDYCNFSTRSVSNVGLVAFLTSFLFFLRRLRFWNFIEHLKLIQELKKELLMKFKIYLNRVIITLFSLINLSWNYIIWNFYFCFKIILTTLKFGNLIINMLLSQASFEIIVSNFYNKVKANNVRIKSKC